MSHSGGSWDFTKVYAEAPFPHAGFPEISGFETLFPAGKITVNHGMERLR